MTYRPRNRIWTPSALSASPVSTADLMEHLRISDTGETDLVAAYGLAACLYIEKFTQRLLTSRAATLLLPDLPSDDEPIELPGGAVASITAVTADGSAVTGAVAYGDSPAILVPSGYWPAVTGTRYPVSITYVVGCVTLPADLVHAVKLLVAEMYLHRSDSEDIMQSPVSLPSRALMGMHRISPL